MPVTEINNIEDKALEVFSSLTERQLKCGIDGVSPLFIAESPKVITAAMDAGLEPISILCERKHITGDAAPLIQRFPQINVYTGEREILKSLTGYTLTRGVLCAFKRPEPLSAEVICRNAKRVIVIDGVCDTTNVGAIFRDAAALGIDAVLLTRTSCDPLNRRCVRVSMGTVFKVPWAWIENPIEFLRNQGIVSIALALREDALSLNDDFLKQLGRIALIVGTEGDGLSSKVIENADHIVMIPMKNGVDSLNVAAATAIAIWELRIR